MDEFLKRRKAIVHEVVSYLITLLLFWIVLLFIHPDFLSQYLHNYTPSLFLLILVLYLAICRLPERARLFMSLALTMSLVALTLSYLWVSGFSDNMIIGGLLPYKDGKNYYFGANLILNGLPVINAGQSTERPLFPGFLSLMLFLAHSNLKIALAVIVQMVGIGLHALARQIQNSFGALASSLFATLTYFYIQSFIGYTLSEMLGFLAGCTSFIILLLAANHPKWFDLGLGMSALMIGVSARAGAFLIFPLLALWVGWVFRRNGRFSWKASLLAVLIQLIAFFFANSVYPRLLGIPPGAAFGNFSYALYGQVRGGTGWHSAIEELGTRNPAVVYRATLDFFLKHPISLFIGFVKSYRDFFLFSERGIFTFGYNGRGWLPILIWLVLSTLLVCGLIWLSKDLRSNNRCLLIAGFVGVFLSIPFLPPIDGGSRFHASTMPFLFALPAVGINLLLEPSQNISITRGDPRVGLRFARLICITLILAVIIVPPAIYSASQMSAYRLPICSPQQEPYAIEYHPGSYIDIFRVRSRQCGILPELCFDEFEGNNTEKSVDDFYQTLFFLYDSGIQNVRILPALDLIEQKFHYFYITHDKIPDDFSPGLISGCAVEIVTKNQSIFSVESILTNPR